MVAVLHDEVQVRVVLEGADQRDYVRVLAVGENVALAVHVHHLVVLDYVVLVEHF